MVGAGIRLPRENCSFQEAPVAGGVRQEAACIHCCCEAAFNTIVNSHSR